MKWEDLEEGDVVKFNDEFIKFISLRREGDWVGEDMWKYKEYTIKDIYENSFDNGNITLYFKENMEGFTINRKTGVFFRSIGLTDLQAFYIVSLKD